VPVEDLKLLEALEDKIDLDEARQALSEAKRKGTKSWDKDQERIGHLIGEPHRVRAASRTRF
jgi:hypothetical protein